MIVVRDDRRSEQRPKFVYQPLVSTDIDSEISRIYELKRQMMRLLRTPVDWISPLTYCTWRNCTSSNAA